MDDNKKMLPSDEGNNQVEDAQTETPVKEATSGAEEHNTSNDVIPSANEETLDSNLEIATSPSAPRNDPGGNEEQTSEKSRTETQAEESSETKEVVDESAEESKSTDEVTTDSSKNDNPNAKWYVVHTYSGHENRVATTLKQRIESEHLEEKILDILVPTQDKIEIKSGKKVNVKEKIFPGYILVKMVLDDASWLAVRTTQGVTSFVGIGNKPTPISEAEVQTIIRFTKEEAPTYKQVFTLNDTVKIVDGPFAEFIGKVDHVDEEKGKVKVLVSIFGRETPVELDFLQVQRI